MRNLTQEELKRLLHYDPETGLFTWLGNKGSRGKAGATAGHKNKGNGYINMVVNKERYNGHQLAFLYMTGMLAPVHTDHINGIRHDNRWCNLRPVTAFVNHKNRRKHKSNKSGINGVCWLKNMNKWQVQIRYNYKTVHLGLFSCKIDAVAARLRANKDYGFHENHGSVL